MRPTIDPEVWKRYQAHRAKEYPLRGFKIRPAPRIVTFIEESFQGQYIKEARWIGESDFVFLARFVFDDDPRGIEDLGEFTDKGDFPETLARDKHRIDRHDFKRFRPEYPIEERFETYHNAGMARGPAYAKAIAEARSTMERAESFGDSWYFCGLRVWCFKIGTMLEDLDYEEPEDNEECLGEDSLWGIESDADEDYLEERALDVAEEALYNARRTIEQRCARAGQTHFAFFGV